MRIYGLMIVKWGGGCGCGGVVDGRKSGGWAALLVSLWRGGWFVKEWGSGQR